MERPQPFTKSANTIEEVIHHPLLTLLDQVNPIHNAFDLWELTTLYQEVHGSAYWCLVFDPLGVPKEFWILPSQNVTPRREPNSPNIVDYYEYRTGARAQNFAPEQIIHFRYPDPRDPYTSGLSPLRAAFEDVSLISDYAAFKQAKFQNRAIPDAIVSPDEVIGEEERDRIEAQWNQKFRRGGAGRILVGETGLKVQLLSQSMGDIAAMAEMGKTKEDIANAFHVPLAFLTTQTNLANLQAAEHQHMAKFVKDGDTRGIKAKTVYPPMPASWPAGECWEPDRVFAQIQAGLLNAKSIGWLPTKAHFADVKEAAKNNWAEGTLVVEEWLLIEYAVGTIPVNPETVVEIVSKTIPGAEPVPFVTLAELEKSIQKQIESIDLSGIVQELIARKQGRV